MFHNIYKGKKVFITGHTGFKGGWIALWLKELGAEIIGYSLPPPTKPSFFESVGLESIIDHHVIGDIRDRDKLISVMKEFKPDFVFHLSAQPFVRLSYKEPLLTYETNVMGTVNLFEAVKNINSVKVLINVTSDKCYENKEWVYGYREIDPLGGYDPYSSSKACSELITNAYRNSFFKDKAIALSSVRAGNVIGGGDWAEDRLIPDCIRALCQNKTIIIRNPQAIRPWQYILEPLSGYLWLGALMYRDNINYSSSWNFGPVEDDIITVEDVVRLTLKYWGNGDYALDTAVHPHEASLLKLDCSKAHSILKWQPVYNTYKAIEETIHWYKEYYNIKDKDKMNAITISQIEGYVKEARNKKIPWCIN